MTKSSLYDWKDRRENMLRIGEGTNFNFFWQLIIMIMDVLEMLQFLPKSPNCTLSDGSIEFTISKMCLDFPRIQISVGYP